jgi:dTDP-4-amino-4,6-dideoxygalactose transaminase
VSTANAAAARGASVVFADVDPRTLNLDPASVAEKITGRTKVILPVHLYGQCCDMDTIMDLARPRGIDPYVFEGGSVGADRFGVVVQED